MPINFTKLSGSGNDFIFIDNRDNSHTNHINDDFIKQVCARGLSVGADGIMFIENSDKADFKWQFFNSDASRADMCGNGARCATRFAYLKGIASQNMTFETDAGIIEGSIIGDEVKVQLTSPHSMVLDSNITVDNKTYDMHTINTGVPHAIIYVDNVADVDVQSLGASIRYHEDFKPAGTNVNFVSVNNGELAIRTYERGVEGETLACGTGSVAAAIISVEKGLASSPVDVKTASGKYLKVYIEDKGVYLQGEARVIYDGSLSAEAFEY